MLSKFKINISGLRYNFNSPLKKIITRVSLFLYFKLLVCFFFKVRGVLCVYGKASVFRPFFFFLSYFCTFMHRIEVSYFNIVAKLPFLTSVVGERFFVLLFYSCLCFV